MERLTKRQREILGYLYGAYPHRISKWEILHEFDDGDTRMEIKILEGKKLINVYRHSGMRTRRNIRYRLGDVYLTIAPKGIEKLRENFITRLCDAAYDNPLKAISTGIALASVILGLITLGR